MTVTHDKRGSFTIDSRNSEINGDDHGSAAEL